MGPSTGKCFVYLCVVLINTFRVPRIDKVDFLSPVPSASLYAGTPKNKPHLRNLKSSSSYLQEQTKNQTRTKNPLLHMHVHYELGLSEGSIQ